MNIDGQAIENIKSFIYLGRKFTMDNDCSKDIVTIYMERQWDIYVAVRKNAE